MKEHDERPDTRFPRTIPPRRYSSRDSYGSIKAVAFIQTRSFHHCRVKKVGPCARFPPVRGHPFIHRSLPLRLFTDFITSRSNPTFELFDFPSTSTCQSWQATSRKSPPRRMYRPLFRLSIKCVYRPPDVNVTLTTDFTVPQLPVLYVVRFSLLPFSVIPTRLIGLPHPSPNRSSFIPSSSSLCGTYQRSGT